MDFVFFVGDFLFPGDAPNNNFRHATQIITTLDNQKNSIQGETVSYFCSESTKAYPVKASIDIFLYLQDWGYDPTTPISDLSSDYGLCSVSASKIIAIIRTKCLRLGAARLGFSPENIGTYSLRSGGAMAMHIPNVPDQTLTAIVRWWSLGFMVYIHHKILSFRTGVSVKMSQKPWYQDL